MKPKPKATDWMRLVALTKDHYGWEDIVVILRDIARREGRVPAWTANEIRNYVLRGANRKSR